MAGMNKSISVVLYWISNVCNPDKWYHNNITVLKRGVIDFRNNFLRLCVLKVTQQSEKHLEKILNVDEFVKRVFSVIHSNDPVARAITLRFFLLPFIIHSCALFCSMCLFTVVTSDQDAGKFGLYHPGKEECPPQYSPKSGFSWQHGSGGCHICCCKLFCTVQVRTNLYLWIRTNLTVLGCNTVLYCTEITLKRVFDMFPSVLEILQPGFVTKSVRWFKVRVWKWGIPVSWPVNFVSSKFMDIR